ncbi:MAG: AarF/ABC1/UbiB kinase family protein, partial [Verrucomicrobiota bacterium]
MKVGQVLAMRTDLYSMEFCDEMSNLQDRAFAFDSAVSRQIIEENLGGQTIDQVFDRFNPSPFAAASLSQVHKGRLRKNKQWVAIKVQRPFAKEYFEYDFRWLSRIARCCEKQGILPNYQWGQMIAEIDQLMREELDYRHEGSEMKRMRGILKEHNVYVPRVYFKYNTRVLLVMEFLDGIFMSDYIKVQRKDPARTRKWCKKNKIRPKKLATVLLKTLMRQVYEDYVFHGDLHPGNIVILRGNKVAFIDFGNTGIFDIDFSTKYDQYSRAIGECALNKAADLFLLLAGRLPVMDIDEVKQKLVRSLQRQQALCRIKNLPFHEKSLSATTGEMNRLTVEYNL